MRALRAAWRDAWAKPLISTLAVASMALALGANVAVFSVFSALRLRPLPLRQPDRLVAVVSEDDTDWALPASVWRAITDLQLFPEGAAAWSWTRFDASQGGAVDPIDGAWVSGNFFSVMGVTPASGRSFGPFDDRPGGGADGRVAVISARLAATRFGGAEPLGRVLFLDGAAFTIVGVLAAGFESLERGQRCDVLAPIGAAVGTAADAPGNTVLDNYVLIVGRLSAGDTIASASERLRASHARIRTDTMPAYSHAEDRDAYLRTPLGAIPLAEIRTFVRARYEKPLLILWAIVVLVLVVACANVAYLLMDRAEGRRYEMAVRVALGATRGALLRQAFLEHAVLAATGAALGLTIAGAGARALVAQFSTEAYAFMLDVGVDWRVAGFACGLGAATLALFGFGPAMSASAAVPLEAMRRRARSAAGRSRRIAGIGVAVQTAVALTVLVLAIVLIRAFTALASASAGFDRDRVLIASVDPSRTAAAAGDRAGLYARLAEEVGRMPGIAAAAASKVMPSGNYRIDAAIDLPGFPAHGSSDHIRGNNITPGWFTAMGTPFRGGRDFSVADGLGAPAVAIVNEAFSRRLPAGTPAVGSTIPVIDESGRRKAVTIVGLVADAVYDSIRVAPPPTIYYPIAQIGDRSRGYRAFNLIVRSNGSPPASLKDVVARGAVNVDPSLSLTFRTLRDQVNAAYNQERIVAALSTAMGALALLLATLGLYGVTAAWVTAHRAEIGVRLALGATGGSVGGLVLGRLGRQMLPGAAGAIGLVALSVTALAKLQFPTSHVGAAFGIGSAVLLIICAAAGLVPAARAARLNPSSVLREGS